VPDSVIVCGLGRFGLRIVELLRAEGVAVTVLTTPQTREDRQLAVLSLGAEIIHGDFRFVAARSMARLEDAQSIVLAASDDVINLEAALDIRAEFPTMRVVMRHSDPQRAVRLQADFGIHSVLSPSTLAAAHFVEAALVPIPGSERLKRRRFTLPHLGMHPSFPLPMIALILLFVAGVLIFHRVVGLAWIDSAYFTSTILTTVGFGDFNLQREPSIIKLFGIVLMFGGAILLATLSSFLTHFVLSGAAAQARAERLARSYKGHYIVCGLGSVGYEIVRSLQARKLKVVVIDSTSGDDLFRETAVQSPIILGDAGRSETLIRAGIERASAVIAVTSSDAQNLEIGLSAQALIESNRPQSPLRLVLRCFDAELARRVHSVSQQYTLLSAAQIAAPLFVAAALNRDRED
jgi:voltage-gated potassium channel Kch